MERDLESINEEKSTNALLVNTRCCFCFPCLGSRRPTNAGIVWWERVRSSSSSQNDEKWWCRGIKTLKKLREWSEIVAGPKWKTFIRRFNRNRTCGGGGGKRHGGNFQYDSLSYSLNFDNGSGHNGNFENEEIGGLPDFSTQYAAVSAKLGTMDYGDGKGSGGVRVK